MEISPRRSVNPSGTLSRCQRLPNWYGSMWLIPRNSDGCHGGRITLPALVKEALVRWYIGQGSRADEDAGIMLVQQARIGERWIACDCLDDGEAPPILTPAFLSEADTYYLRRLTSAKRPEHRTNCPFFREQATNRLSEVRTRDSAAEPPIGYFEVLRPAPENLAQRPDTDETDDRTRLGSIPRLARLLWRLLALSRLNLCPPLREEDPLRSITREFQRLSVAAALVEIAPGVELGRAFWTHARPLHSGRVYAALRALETIWPRGHAPQSFLALYAQNVRGSTIEVAGGAPVVLANRVQLPSIRANRIKGPYLVLVVAGQYPEARGYAALRGYAQPIFKGNRFVPVDSEFERLVLGELINLRRYLDRDGWDLSIEKPLFDTLTPLGSCRPDFVLEAFARKTGEIRRIVVEGMCSHDPDYHASKALAHLRMMHIAPLALVSIADVETERVGEIVRSTLAI